MTYNRFKRKDSENATITSDEADYAIFEKQIFATKGIRAVTFGTEEIVFHYPYGQTVSVKISPERMNDAMAVLYRILNAYELNSPLKHGSPISF